VTLVRQFLSSGVMTTKSSATHCGTSIHTTRHSTRSSCKVTVIRDVKQSLNFRTSGLKFEFDLHTFGVRISDYLVTTTGNKYGAVSLMFLTS